MCSAANQPNVYTAGLFSPASRQRVLGGPGRPEGGERFAALGGYEAESEAARISNSLGLPDRILAQPLRTLSGGQRRRVR